MLIRTREYITQNFLYTHADYALAEDAALFDKGIIDSLGIVELLGFLASEFGVVVLDVDISDENLGSLGALTDFVWGKLDLSKQA